MEIVSWDLDDVPEERVEWLWEGMIGRGLMTLLASAPKVGKSTLLYHLLSAMYKGEPLFGLSTQMVPTLIFTEDPAEEIRNRRDLLGLHGSPIHCVPIQPGLTWPEVILFAKRKIENSGVGLLILDTVSRFWGVTSEDDAAEVIRTLGPLYALTRHHNVGTVLVHHTRKARGYGGRAIRGSNALPGAVDVIIEFDKINRYDTSTRRRLDILSRFSLTTPQIIGEITPEGKYVPLDSSHGTEQSVLRFILETPGSTADDVSEVLGLSERHAQRTLSDLVARGILVRSGSGSGRSPYRYAVGTEA